MLLSSLTLLLSFRTFPDAPAAELHAAAEESKPTGECGQGEVLGYQRASSSS